MSPRRILGWSFASLLGLVGIGALGMGVRQHLDGRDLEGALARSAEDQAWIDARPAVAPDARERAWAWMMTPWPTDPVNLGNRREAWYLAGGEPPAELVARHEADRTHMAELDAVLAIGGPVLSSTAWLETELRTNGNGPYGPKHIPNLLSARSAINWYGLEAMLAKDPTRALDQVDRLFEALQPAGGLIDALILVSISAERDRIYLRAQYKGALDTKRHERWLAEACAVEQWHIDAYRAERLLLWAPLGHGILASRANAKQALYGEATEAREELDYRWHARRDVARVLAAWRLYEDYVSGRCDASALDVIETWRQQGGLTAGLALPNHMGMVWNVVGARAQHRLSRLLAHTLHAAPQPPVSEETLIEELPEGTTLAAAGRFDVRIRYQRVADDRIRFYVPRDTPLPALLEMASGAHRFEGVERRANRTAALSGPVAGAIEARLPR